MKHDPSEIEDALRRAPAPAPPPDLRDRLPTNARATQTGHPPAVVSVPGPHQRWWPALTATCLALASLGLVAMQHAQIKALRQSVDSLRQEIETLQTSPKVMTRPGTRPQPRHQPIHVPIPNGRAELEKLRVGTEKFRAQIQHREGLAAENARLEKELDTLARQAHPEVFAAMDAAKAEAARTRCVNNLKVLGMAARIYATDNDDQLPPNITVMSNAVSSLKTLICPADTGRQPAASWAAFTPANSSYEYLAVNGSETEPQRVMFRCRVHGFVTLCDGSVQRLSEQAKQEQLEWRDGKLWYKPVAPPPEALPKMDRLMMERYGLLPSGEQSEEPPAPDETSSPAPQMDQLMMERYGLLPKEEQPEEAPAPDETSSPAPQMDRLMMERYGLLPKEEPPADDGQTEENPQ